MQLDENQIDKLTDTDKSLYRGNKVSVHVVHLFLYLTDNRNAIILGF